MLQSQLFTRTRKEAPKDEVSRSAELLIRGGYIYKEMAGVYTYLPLGLRVLNKIIGIIREEMDAIGGQEILMTSLQESSKWEKTDRWDDKKVDIWFKTTLTNGATLGLANTHEEAITAMMAAYVQSYQDLPQYVYQFQTKFRNELRAKSGIMRTREFIMKDLYSFTKTTEELDQFYEKAITAYKKIFQRIGLGDKTYVTFASGGIFSKYSHEFQTICNAGEDTIYIDEEKKVAVNLEVCQPEVLEDLKLKKEELVAKKAIEVGNIFKLGTRFSEPLGLTYTDESGAKYPVVMGSYGIGPGRVLGTVAEVLSDNKGLIWPKSIAPFTVHLISLQGKSESVLQKTKIVYEELQKKGVEVLWDDRSVSAGEKFADSDLLGLPYRVVVSEKTLAENKVELKERTGGEVKLILEKDLYELLA